MGIVRATILNNQPTFSTNETCMANMSKYVFVTDHNRYEVKLNTLRSEYTIKQGGMSVFYTKSFTKLLERLKKPYY